MPPTTVTHSDDTKLPEETRQEFKRLFTGKTYAFTDIIEEIEDRESYFVSSAGVVIRILRAPWRVIDTLPAHMQFFDFDGALVTECTKVRESSAAFFLRKFQPELIRSKCFELSDRPSFIPIPNTNDIFEVVPRNVFSPLSCRGLNPE
jgi:hypothetical protein